ncbi:glycosyltransferase [Namhaeicola litoreus]|uniref:Glycosyltransferase n=1 Tax=Namhaeicola litoreus TaxID=1052145 RepID=A0ABW3Y6J8_9FLAO
MTVFIVFLLVFFVQLFFFSFFFKKLQSKSSHKLECPPGVSIVVCAKNEANNLPHLLPILASQNYPKYEIVLVNDRSKDGTLSILESFKKAHNKLDRPIKIVDLSNSEITGKKNAIQKGIEVTEFKNLLFTDADCLPHSINWLERMTVDLNLDREIVLGYGPYRKIQKSFLNKLIRFETLMTAIQYFSYAERGIPYMGVGRNLAYHKDVFLSQNGFESHKSILSGDDDLFVSAVANNKNTAICLSKESFVTSEPPETMKTWIRQKRRHITTSVHYQFKHQFLLTLFYVSQLLFWILSFYLLFHHIQVYIVLALVLVRYFFWHAKIKHNAKVLDEDDLIYRSVWLEFCLICFQLYIFIANLFSPSKKW